MDNGNSFTVTSTNTHSTSKGDKEDIYKPLILRSSLMIASTKNLEDPCNLVATNRISRIQWSKGTIINSDMGKKKANCCGVYPDPSLFNSSSSSSSSSSSDEESEEVPKAYRCSKLCYGHPIVTFPKSDVDVNINSDLPPAVDRTSTK